MPTYDLIKYTCPHCNNEYEDLERSHFPGKPCKKCTQLMIAMGELQRRLLAREVSLENEDHKIAAQINDILVRQRISGISDGDEKLLDDLTKKMLSDENRRKKVIKEIIRLQKKKH